MFSVTASINEFFTKHWSGEQVTIYKSYGYLEEDSWVIPLRVYVHEERRMVGSLVSRIVTGMEDLNPDEIELFRSRFRDFIADSESGETVRLHFKNDPDDEVHKLLDDTGVEMTSDRNGIIEGRILISKEKALQLYKNQPANDPWLTLCAVSDGHEGCGKVKLIENRGLSVISDIDDTIKITEIPAGSRVVIRNTFFKDYKPVEEMIGRFKTWQSKGAAFHYVTGSPWQLYRPLSEFLFHPDTGFPKGTFHMKGVYKNPMSITNWRGLIELTSEEGMTFGQKKHQISTIIEAFPDKQFILVGDSGERDPEIFNEIQNEYPGKIREIIIRDTINDRELNPARLNGFTVIAAPTVKAGESLFD